MKRKRIPHPQANPDPQQSETRLREFFEEAYWLQRGEYFHVNHVKNIDQLHRRFGWDVVMVDALYRLLPHFDYLAEEAAKRVKARTLTAEAAFQELCLPIFYYFSEPVKRRAWALHLEEL